MITDTHCAPVVAAAGFAETDLIDDAHVYMAVYFIMHDKAIEDLALVIEETLNTERRNKHAASEPPLTAHMPDEAFVEWVSWYDKVTAGGKPYESIIMALQMLKPKEKAALRARVLEKVKASEVTV